MVKTRKMGRRRRRCDRGGDWKRRVEAPFKWSWRHALIPNYLTGKFTKKGPNLKESVNEVFTWKGIYNKGAKGSKGTKGAKGGRRRRRRRTRRRGKRHRKRCTRRKFRRNHRRRRRRTLRGGLPSPTSMLKYVGGKPSGCPPLNGLWSAGIDSAKPCSLL
jgi:hypothetical protein